MAIALKDTDFEFDKFPDTCPICHHGIQPALIASNYIAGETTLHRGILQLFLRCPKEDCQNGFIASYRQSKYERIPRGPYYLLSTAPWTTKPPAIPTEVGSVSSTFAEIYTQSAAAEHYNLTQVAGAGYRKALEFLVKDFCVRQNPTFADKIKSTFLGKCIEDYVSDSNLKVCAKRAAWLGNDEVHYIRQWEEKDISDLKVLIELSMGWIRSIILTEKYSSDMK